MAKKKAREPRVAKYVHVSLNALRGNRKTGSTDPPIRVRSTRSGPSKAVSSEPIYDAAGNVVAVVSYHPDRPLSCGAVVYVVAYFDAPAASAAQSTRRRGACSTG